ncbi:hypothetical protein JQK15_19660 [Sphingobium sp. BHU LFT2]|uniref:hypothetical protein n=1 Tax=Sphingobium sp. BHU LFT2 TaxID=2807634 RepID=UPI001BE817B6|nr:hypothetical protein [Sphingobium sp. BHU LFT2]MBT2245735.1 hypothetical protein [Sphingobium sp. BHU LFT2]
MEPVRKPAKTLPPPTPAKAPPKAAQVPLSQAALLQSRIGAAAVGKLIASRSGSGKAPAATPGAPSRHASNDQAPQGKGSHAAKTKKDADGAPGKAREAAPEGEAPVAAGADGKDAGGVKLHMPEPPTKPSKATMDRIAGVQKRAGGAATAQGALPTADKQVADAQKAVTEPDAQRIAEARAQLIAEMHAAPSPDIEKLCTDIADAIRRRRPPDEDALDKAEPAKEAMAAGATLNSTVETQSKKVTDNYSPLDKPPEPAPGTPAPPLAPQPAAAPAAAPAAKAAVPDAVGADKLSLDKDAEEARKKVDDAGMNKPAAALVQSGPVAEAREAQGELDQTAKEDPAKIVAQQKEALAKANEDMGALQMRALAALTAHRAGTVGKTMQRQTAMVGTEAQMREQAGTQARAAFTSAKEDVQGLLKDLVPNAMNKWEAAKTDLTTTFKADLKGVADQVKKRHESTLAAIADYFTGLPDWATEGYDRAEKNFADGVIKKLREISTEVDAIIKACEARIKQARDEIAVIFNSLPASLKEWATKEQAGFDTQLDKLGQEVHQTRDAFNKDLGQRAAQAVDEVRAEIAELRKKAGGLVGRIVDAVKRFVDDPVKFIIEGLLELLGISPPAFWAVVAKIKKVVRDIIDDPVNFANNLLKGIGQGFSQFFDNFPTHMIKGFLGWLLGDLKDVQVPKDFSLKSVITFFLQIMGITWPNIRKIIAKKIGEKNVALIEQVWSLVSMLIDKGPEGIFEMIREKLDPQSILDQVIQMAVDYMVTAIVKAVAARLILLFNPAGAILQAIEAIYKVLKWVFENAARIFTLIETIVNGLADIIAGNVAGFANAVEKGLAMLIAPVLGFIADYLGFGDLPKAVAKQIKSFQKWILGIIEKAFDWLIAKGKALLAALGIGGKKDKDKEKKTNQGVAIGEDIPFEAGGEAHHVWVDVSGGNATLMVASKQQTVAAFLNEVEQDGGEMAAKAKRAKTLLGKTDKAADELAKIAAKPSTDDKAPATGKADAKNKALTEDEKALVSVLAEIFQSQSRSIQRYIGKGVDTIDDKATPLGYDVWQDNGVYEYGGTYDNREIQRAGGYGSADTKKFPKVHVDQGGLVQEGADILRSDWEVIREYEQAIRPLKVKAGGSFQGVDGAPTIWTTSGADSLPNNLKNSQNKKRQFNRGVRKQMEAIIQAIHTGTDIRGIEVTIPQSRIDYVARLKIDGKTQDVMVEYKHWTGNLPEGRALLLAEKLEDQLARHISGGAGRFKVLIIRWPAFNHLDAASQADFKGVIEDAREMGRRFDIKVIFTRL